MSTYRIEYRIGAGGMGTVYRATRILANGDEQSVACKMMHQARMGKRNGIRRFHTEARLMLALQHDHVVRMIDYVTDDDGGLYLIMELVEGVSVAEIVDAREQPRLSHDMVRVIAADVLEALSYLHDHDVLHRDISPGNLLVCQSGAIKVADFGVSKMLATGAEHSADTIGKLSYLAPEVCKGATLDPRSDLFAFAATMYELLAGEPPFGQQMPSLAVRRLEGNIAPLPDAVPDDLRTLVMDLLACNPDERQPLTARDARRSLAIPTNRSDVAAELGLIAKRRYEAKCQGAAVTPCALLDARAIVQPNANGDFRRERGESTRSADSSVSSEADGERGVESQKDGERLVIHRPRLAVAWLAAIAVAIWVLTTSSGNRSATPRSATKDPDPPPKAEQLEHSCELSTAPPSPTPHLDGIAHLQTTEHVLVPMHKPAEDSTTGKPDTAFADELRAHDRAQTWFTRRTTIAVPDLAEP